METIKEARLRCNMKQSDLAGALGRNTYEISNYENDINIPTIPDIVKLETLLGTRLNFDEPVDSPGRIQFLHNFSCLCRRFPMVSVLALAMKSAKEDNPGELLSTYCKIYKTMDGKGDVQVNIAPPPDPLYPAGDGYPKSPD